MTERFDPKEAMDDAMGGASYGEHDGGTSNVEVVKPADWWTGNPYLEENAKGTDYLVPQVPALVWWLEHPESGLSHVRFNKMTATIEAELLPWNAEPHVWSGEDDSNLFAHMQVLSNNLLKSEGKLKHALIILAGNRKYDPLLDMLDALSEWDGQPRAETIFTDFLGAADTSYTRAVARHMLNGAVMRAYHPGVKYDECVVLDSKRQGLGKSTFLERLSMNEEYYADGVGDLGKSKDVGENLRGKWIVEIAELNDLSRQGVDTVKQFISRRVDRYRASYERNSQDWPRRCIFVGTTNKTAFLTDRTGNRRFLVVECDVQKPRFDVFSDLTPEYVGQVWAEVLHDYRANGSLPLVLPRDVLADAESQRVEFAVDNPDEGMVLAWVREHCRPGEPVCIAYLQDKVFGMDKKDRTTPQARKQQRELQMFLDISPEFERVKGKPTFSSEYGQQKQWTYKPRD